jgi:hypothetical protein
MIYNFHTLELLLTLILKSTQSLIHTFFPQLTVTLLLLYSYIPISFKHTFILAPTAKITDPITNNRMFKLRNNPLKLTDTPNQQFFC